MMIYPLMDLKYMSLSLKQALGLNRISGLDLRNNWLENGVCDKHVSCQLENRAIYWQIAVITANRIGGAARGQPYRENVYEKPPEFGNLMELKNKDRTSTG